MQTANCKPEKIMKKILTNKYLLLFSRIILENKSKYWGAECFVSSLSKSDFEWFWKGIGGGEKYKLIIYEKTGGYMALIKGTIIDRDILIKAIWGEYASQNI